MGNKYLPLALAILTAALLQAILIARMPTVSADGIIFTRIARDLTIAPSQAFHKHDQHPGYPAAMLAATRVIQSFGYRDDPGAWMAGGRFVSFVCGLLTVWVVWLLTRDLFDVQVANWAALIFAVLPIVRLNASDAQSDTAHLLCYMTATWLATSALVSGSLWRLAGAGLASALAYWIRPEGLEVLVGASICLAWQSFRMHWSWRRLTLTGTVLAGTALLVAAPYPLLAGKFTSKQLPFAKPQEAAPSFIAQLAVVQPETKVEAEPPVETQTPMVAAPPVETLPVETPPAATATPDAPMADAVLSEEEETVVPAETVTTAEVSPPTAPPADPTPPVELEKRYTWGLVLRLVGKAYVSLVVSICQGFKFVFLPLYFLGQWELIRRKPDWFTIAFLWCLAILHMSILMGVYILSGYIAHRHVLPLLALAMPFTALGLLYVGEKLAQRLKVKPLYAAVGTMIVCTALVLPYSVRAYNREFLPVIAATEWVRAHAEPGEGIVCNSPYVAYYCNLPTAILGPDGLTLDAALRKAGGNARYDYVVLHVGAFDYHPEWQTQVEERYREVLCLPDPYATTRVRKVLVFEAKDRQARKAAGRSPS